MANLLPRKKIVWFGVYHTSNACGIKFRSLKFIFPTKAEALEKVEEILNEFSWRKKDEFFVEEVDVIMRSWKIG